MQVQINFSCEFWLKIQIWQSMSFPAQLIMNSNKDNNDANDDNNELVIYVETE